MPLSYYYTYILIPYTLVHIDNTLGFYEVKYTQATTSMPLSHYYTYVLMLYICTCT